MLVSQVRTWQLGDLGASATDLRGSARTLNTGALTLLNRLKGVSTDWEGEARDKAAVVAADSAASMEQKSLSLQAAANILDTAAEQMGLLRDAILGMVDDPENTRRFTIADDGAVSVSASYAAELQTRSNCDAALFNSWMAQVESDRRDLERTLKNQLASADASGQYFDWQITNALMGVTASERPFEPRIPPPPAKPTVAREKANRDGSGPDAYNTYEPSVFGKIGLQELKALARAGAFSTSGGLAGQPNAASMLDHYLGNTGAEYKVNIEAMMNEISGFQNESENEAKRQLRIAQEDMPVGYDGPVAFQGSYYDNLGYSADWKSSSDWYLAVHDFNYQTSGVGTPGVAGYDLNYQTSVYDYYNWESTGAFPSVQASDLNNLNRAGWAQTFDVTGTSATKQVRVP